MNPVILKKCLDELSKDQPNIDYVRGMLETMIELGGSSAVERSVVTRDVGGSTPSLPADTPKDEGSILDAQARAAVKAVQEIAAKSTTND